MIKSTTDMTSSVMIKDNSLVHNHQIIKRLSGFCIMHSKVWAFQCLTKITFSTLTQLKTYMTYILL